MQGSSDDILSIDLLGGKCLRVSIGTANVGLITQLNAQLLQDFDINRKDLAYLLCTNRIDDLVIAREDLPESVGSTHNNAGPRSLEAMDELTIYYRKVPDGKLGVELELLSDPDHKRTAFIVSRVYRATGSLLSTGDIIVAVNGISILGISPANALKLLQTSINRQFTIIKQGSILGFEDRTDHSYADIYSSSFKHTRSLHLSQSLHDLQNALLLHRKRDISSLVTSEVELLRSAYTSGSRSTFQYFLNKYQ